MAKNHPVIKNQFNTRQPIYSSPANTSGLNSGNQPVVRVAAIRNPLQRKP